MRARVLCLLLAGYATGACVKPPETPPPPRMAPLPPAISRPSPPAWTYYTPIDVRVRTDVRAANLPLDESQITLLDTAPARWATLPPALKDGVRRAGFAVLPSEAKRSRLGEYYADLRAARMPYVITIDALVLLAHVALDRALAEAEEKTLVPALDALLKQLDARLTAERRGANGDVAPAYDLARGIVAVGQKLMGATYVPPDDLAPIVSDEVKRVLAHDGTAPSPLLGVVLDYSAFAPRGAADKSEGRASYFRAMTWLATAPMMLVARGERPGAAMSTSRVRTHARAALLLARLLDPEVDPVASKAYQRIAHVSELVGGASDDPSPRDFAAIGTAIGIDVKDVSAIANVAKLDHLRHALVERTPPRAYDGTGAARAAIGDANGSAARASTSVRLFPPRGTPDMDVLEALVFPSIGKIASDAEPQPPTAQGGLRALPSALDVGAWLGATEARAVLHESGDDAYAGYDDAMKQLDARRPAEERRHASIYLSTLDALQTILAPSAADASLASSATTAWRRRKLEVTLAGWTALRHDTVPFARFPLGPFAEQATPASPEPSVNAFVEPQPESIAALQALVRQVTRGLWAVAELEADSPSRALLEKIDGIFSASLAIALREVNDEALEPAEKAALDDLPARLVALETALAASHSADASLVTDVHVDAGGARVLEEATGDLDDMYIVLREPRSGRMVLAVGASLPHYELVQPTSARLSDDGWRARLHAASPPERDAFTSVYVVVPPH